MHSLLCCYVQERDKALAALECIRADLQRTDDTISQLSPELEAAHSQSTSLREQVEELGRSREELIDELRGCMQRNTSWKTEWLRQRSIHRYMYGEGKGKGGEGWEGEGREGQGGGGEGKGRKQRGGRVQGWRADVGKAEGKKLHCTCSCLFAPSAVYIVYQIAR